MEVNRYYMARAQGNMMAEAPPELVELGLMERFHWTPKEINEIPLGKLQRLFVAMEQREQSKVPAAEIEAKRTGRKGKK